MSKFDVAWIKETTKPFVFYPWQVEEVLKVADAAHEKVLREVRAIYNDASDVLEFERRMMDFLDEER